MTYFLESREPLASAFAKWLTIRFENEIAQTPPLIGTTVIVPTNAAAKNLRNRFNALLAELKKGAVGISFTTLESLMGHAMEGTKIVSASRNLSIWLDVLAKIDVDEFPNLFPSGAPVRESALAFAEKITALQFALAENLLSISMASKRLGECADSAKWAELAELEKSHYARVKAAGYATRLESLFSAFENLRAGNEKYIVAGVPDVSGTLKKFADAVEGRVDFAVYADVDERGYFGKYGDIDESYGERKLGIDDDRISICLSAESEAEMIAELACDYGSIAADAMAVACEQFKNAPLIKSKLDACGHSAIYSDSENLANTALYRLLSSFAQIVANGGDSASAAQILKNPYFAKKYFCGQSVDSVLKAFDDLLNESVLADIFQVVQSGSGESCAWQNAGVLKQAIADIAKICRELAGADSAKFCSFISKTVGEMAEAFFEVDINVAENEKFACEIFQSVVAEIAECSENSFLVSDCFELILKRLKSSSALCEAPQTSIKLVDWMEIFWAENPHIVLADMNDGIVPFADSAVMLLTDSIRKTLGLRNQQSRRARDAYMLSVLLRTRSAEGRDVSIIVPQKSSDADPLLPSRILMQEENLPARIKLLFAEAPSEIDNPHFVAPWKFRAKLISYQRSLSTSALKSYMESPWNFYLKYVLGAEIFDSEKQELDAAQFGCLFHGVMECFAKSELKDCADAEKIFAALSAHLDNLSAEMFGKNPRTQIRLQIENLRQRLRASAAVQAQHRADGWRIFKYEEQFAFEMSGAKFEGRIDRIDVRDDCGKAVYLVIDYKTADKISPKYVIEEHINSKGVWKNLQLPIYVRAASEIFKDAEIKCGYFLAPKDSTSTQIQIWHDFNAELLDGALAKACEIAGLIQARLFAPTTPPKYDEFADVFGFEHSQIKNFVEFI